MCPILIQLLELESYPIFWPGLLDPLRIVDLAVDRDRLGDDERPEIISGLDPQIPEISLSAQVDHLFLGQLGEGILGQLAGTKLCQSLTSDFDSLWQSF